ncbi:hypothetical protein ACJ41O_003229 [Fusarium nematophilum]
MGVLFSRPGHDSERYPDGAYPAGDISSLNSSSIAPYLGVNTGLLYRDISTANLPPIPFEWIISPSADHISESSCPNGSRILTFFSVTEGVISLLVPLVAYRPLIHFLSRGYLGRRIKNSVALTWTITFMCQLTASAVTAGMVGNTPGYGHLNMLHVFTVYMARPRFHFIILALLRSLVGVRRPREWDKTTLIKRRVDDRIEFPYSDAYIATAASEVILLVVSAIFTGVTWHRLPEARSVSREYIADHVSFVSSAPGVMLLCLLAFVPLYNRYGDAFPLEGRRYEAGRRWGVTVAPDGTATVGIRKTKKKRTFAKRVASAVAGAVLLGYVTLVQFGYWTRFLEIPGVL